MTPIVVFNPHTWQSRVNVEVEYGSLPDEPVLLDDRDRQVPMQLVQSQTLARGRHRLSFIADLPSLGYRTYRLASGSRLNSSGTHGQDWSGVQASDHVLDNGRLRLAFDPHSGEIASLRDLTHGVELFEGPAARAVVLDDPSDTWSHNVFRFDDVVGHFRAQDVRLVEHGPVKSVIRVRSEYGDSRLVQDFTMYPDLEHIDVHVTVDWREQFKALKLRFPLNLTHMRVVSDIPYGHIERFANGEEEPGQAWLDVSGMARGSGEPYGLSLLNDGKYSFDVNIRDVGLTVLRSPIYAHHIPAEPQPEGEYRFIDQGIQRFTYSLLPHAGSWQEAETVRRAAELNQQPTALIGTYHPEGSLPQTGSFVQVDQPNINITVLKQAEDNEDLILRCYETAKMATGATITLPHWQRVIETRFDPCEIKTFRIPMDQGPVIETNLTELETIDVGEDDRVAATY